MFYNTNYDNYDFELGENVCYDDDTFFNTLFKLMTIIFGSISITCFIVSNYLYGSYRYYKNNTSESESDTDEQEYNEIPVVPYEKLYPLRKDIEHIGNPSKNTYITEYTPNGLVFMQYNVDEEGFYYWSNHTIQFKYLETVARKYVNMMQCKDYYISREVDETEDNMDNLNENSEQGEKQEDNMKSDNSPFATLKNYYNNTSEKKQYNSCKFIKRGSINDLNLIHITTTNSKEKNIDFASFKKLFMEKDEVKDN